MSAITILVAWTELPAYAARQIKSVLADSAFSIRVVATRPSVPIADVDRLLGQDVLWVHPEARPSLKDLGLSKPAVLFKSGWNSPVFDRLAAETRAGGGRVVVFSDNSWKGTLRQFVAPLIFRWRIRPFIDALWVPGQSGRRLAEFLGMPNHRVYEGLYGADPDCFPAGPPVSLRPARFLFVGQFIQRKAVHVVAEAFRNFRLKHPDWTLEACGQGPLAGQLQQCEGASVNDFLQPPQVAAAMRSARCLLAPSLEDHWGVVVCEAAASGCLLVVSEGVGSRHDLVNASNGCVVATGNPSALCEAMCWIATRSAAALDEGGQQSLRAASRYCPRTWREAFFAILRDLSIYPAREPHGCA